MSKVTSKLQLTLPKRLAEQYGIKPGDEVEFQAAGECIRLVPATRRISQPKLSIEERLRLFDEQTERIKEYAKRLPADTPVPKDRGWKREDLYTRGKPD